MTNRATRLEVAQHRRIKNMGFKCISSVVPEYFHKFLLRFATIERPIGRLFQFPPFQPRLKRSQQGTIDPQLKVHSTIRSRNHKFFSCIIYCVSRTASVRKKLQSKFQLVQFYQTTSISLFSFPLPIGIKVPVKEAETEKTK